MKNTDVLLSDAFSDADVEAVQAALDEMFKQKYPGGTVTVTKDHPPRKLQEPDVARVEEPLGESTGATRIRRDGRVYGDPKLLGVSKEISSSIKAHLPPLPKRPQAPQTPPGRTAGP